MKLDLKKKYQRISNNVIGGEEDRGMRLEDIWKKRRMVELGLDPTNQDFLPDNDTVYVDQGQFTSSSILHLHLFAMPHMFMFKSSLNQQKTVFAICAPCKKLCFQIRMFFSRVFSFWLLLRTFVSLCFLALFMLTCVYFCMTYNSYIMSICTIKVLQCTFPPDESLIWCESF